MIKETINKSDLISEITRETGYKKKVVDEIICLFIDKIANNLSDGVSVHLREFGTFTTKTHAARKRRNIVGNTEVFSPKKVVPKFTAGSKLSELLNSKN